MKKNRFHTGLALLAGAVVAVSLAACNQPTTPTTMNAATKPAAAGGNAVKPPTPASAAGAIRVKAGVSETLTDHTGLKWEPDTGFVNGTPEPRPDLTVTGTDKPELFHDEDYSMDSWSHAVPNGDYTLKLYFSEAYDQVTGPEGRLFTYVVHDGDASGAQLFKKEHFSPWAAAGAQFKAYVESIPVKVTKGKLTIVFTPETQNPQINAIEILPK